MLKHCVALVVVLMFLVPAATQEPQTAPKKDQAVIPTVPAEAAKKANPVKPTAESIAQGKKYYGFDCAMCHGDSGDGKGVVAVEERFNLKDFRDPATLKDRTDGELFYILKNGKGHMPVEPIRSSPNDLWNLINYIRSLSSKPA